MGTRMFPFPRNTLLLVCVLVSWIISLCCACISTCQCTPRRQKGRTVDCGRLADPISSLADLKFPPDTVHLDLTFNSLVTLNQGWFIQLSILQRLNLSSNKISMIETGAFDGLQSLKRLDLSHNKINRVNGHMFRGLPSLEKLILSFNYISAIPDGTFNDLTSLKKFEIRSIYLWCDCRLKWMLKWAKVRKVRIPSSTTCSLPTKMKGKPLGKLKRRDLVCEKVNLPIFYIRPSESQLVFRGDQLPFECHASVTSGEMVVNWFRSGHPVKTDQSKGVFVNTAYNKDKTVINHKLMVESLDVSHAGEWSCVVSTPSENLTKSVLVQVRNSVIKCPYATNRTAKGVYVWQESPAGKSVMQRCQTGGEGAVATHQCGDNGRWHDLDTSKCSFLREVTRRLEKLADADSETLDIPTHLSGIKKALQLAFEKKEESLNPVDVFYMANIMESTLLPHALDNRQIAGFLVDMVSDMTELSPKVIRNAQLKSHSASRMTLVLSKMLQKMDSSKPSLEWEYHSKEIVVILRNQDEVFRQGLSCGMKKKLSIPPQQTKDTDIIEDSDKNHQSPDYDFTCDEEELLQEKTSLVSVVILPRHGERTLVIQKPKPQPDRTSSSITEVASNPVVSTPTSFSPPPIETSDNETDPTTAYEFINSTLPPSTQSKTTTLQTLAVSTKTAESPGNGAKSISKRVSRSANRHRQQHTKDSRKTYPGSSSSGLSSLSLNAEQLRNLNISTSSLSRLPATINLSNLPLPFDKSLFPFIKLPGASSKSPSLNRRRFDDPKNVFVVIYQTGKLFPILQSEAGDPTFETGTWAVVTPVVVISLGFDKRRNLTTPIALTFEVKDIRRPLKAAYFDYQGINGYGGWSVDGCEIVHRNGSTITVQVHHLSAFAILQEVSYVYRLASFSMEPVIYVGSGLCALCMLIIIHTYICCFSSIGVPKKIKHSVVNLCLSSFLMVLVFALGINRTSMELPCQMVGIGLHYLTLCSLFWITITTNITYKKFVKADRPPEPPPEMVPMPLPPKPILQFYFVGYGVPIIICGITAAVNLDFYAGIKYCFLEWEPSLGAFYAPVALLVAWNLVLFMRISCVVRNSAESDGDRANESEDHEIHNNEIELVPSQPDTNTTTTHNINGRHSNQISNSFSHHRYSRAGYDSSSEDDAASLISLPDQERRPITQLRALVAIHFLFIVMWTCGAVAIAKPFHLIIPYQELIFSYLYGVMSSLFGIFMLIYFLLTRNDSRLSWKRKFGCAPPETYSTPPMEVTETQLESPSPLPAPQTTTVVPIANGTVVKSNSNTNLSVYSQKSSNITKAYHMKNNTNKQSNINLILANSSDLSYGSAQENYPNFYNPRQNGAAKKFWQKNRQHSKVMNKDVNRDLNSSLTDNNSGTELNQPRLSHGTSSEANTHLSIEIQIQPKKPPGGPSKPGSFCGSREIPVHISNSHHNMAASCGAISLEHNNNNINNIGGGQTGIGMEHNDLSSKDNKKVNASSGGSNASLPHYQCSPNSGSSLNTAGGTPHTSAFTPVQPRTNSAGNNGAQVQSTEEGEVAGDGTGDVVQQEEQWKKESSPARNQLSGPDPAPVVPRQQNMNGDFTQRPPNPGVTWSPFPCTLPPLPSHPNNSYSFTPPPQYHQIMQQQQHYAFDFGQYPPNVAFNMNQTQPAMSHPLPLQATTSVVPIRPPPPPHPTTNYNIPPSPYLIQNQSHNRTPKSMSPVSSSSQSQSHNHYNQRHHRHHLSSSWRPLSGGDSSDSSRSRPRHTRSSGSPGRANVVAAPRSPVASDSHASEPLHQVPDSTPNNLTSGPKKARSVDGDHHSDPTHRKKHHHRQDKHRHNKLTNKQRSLGWEEQLKHRTPKINYVYVNHMYRDKVMHKLIKQASESDDLASKAFWLPRSASEYERLTQRGFCSMADDSSSSSDEDSLDNIWIPQRALSDYHKKETSV